MLLFRMVFSIFYVDAAKTFFPFDFFFLLLISFVQKKNSTKFTERIVHRVGGIVYKTRLVVAQNL